MTLYDYLISFLGLPYPDLSPLRYIFTGLFMFFVFDTFFGWFVTLLKSIFVVRDL